jgi:hypothetical protein
MEVSPAVMVMGAEFSAFLPVMPGLDPGIQPFRPWIAGSSPAMTEEDARR